MKFLQFIPEKYLIRAIQVVVGSSLILPLITFSGFYFPFIVPRNIIFRILVELLIVLYVMLVLQNRKYLPRKHSIWISLLVFAGLITLASLFGTNIRHSFWSMFERMDGLITLYHLLAFFFVLYGAFRSRLSFERLLQVSIFVSIIVALVGLSQLFQVNLLLPSSGGARITATLGNATYLAAYMLIHLFLALYFILKKQDGTTLWFFKYGFIILDLAIIAIHIRFIVGGGGSFIGQIFSHPGVWIPFIALQILTIGEFWYRKQIRYVRYATYGLYTFFILLYLLIITTTQTRGALVGLAMALVAAYIFLVFRKGERALVKGIGTAIMVLMVGFVIFVFANKESDLVASQPILRKISSISLEDRTTQTRLATWEAGLKGFRDRPILGWGLENFHQVFNKYFPTIIYVDEGTPLWFDRPHNILVQYLVEGGILSLIAYLVFIGLILMHLIKKRRANYVGIIFSSLIIAYIGQNLFVFDSLNSTLPFFMILAFITYLVSDNEVSDEEGSIPVNQAASTTIAFIVLLFFVMSLWLFNIRPLLANTQFVGPYRQQIDNKRVYDPQITERVFSVLDAAGYIGKTELLGVYSEYAVDLLQQRVLPDHELNELVDGIALRFNEHMAIEKTDARFNMFLMNLYLNAERINGQYLDKLLEVGVSSMELSPTRPQFYYLTGRAHMLQGNIEDGLADFLHAAELAPDVFDAHWNLFAAYITVRDIDSALGEIDILKGIRPFTIVTYTRIAGIFASANEFELSQETLLEATEQFPQTASLYASLADVYAAQGKNALARETVEKTVSIDSSYAADAEIFLQMLEAGELLRI